MSGAAYLPHVGVAEGSPRCIALEKGGELRRVFVYVYVYAYEGVAT